jgi:hypothetical protein
MSLLFALGLAGALIQSPAPPDSASLAGRVVEESTGAPVAGAQVMLMPMEPPRIGRFMRPLAQSPATTTDHDGRYQFDGLAAGRYRLTVQKPGFALLDGPEGPEVDLESGTRRTGVDITLQKGAVIAGRVLDERGEPLADVQVSAMRNPPLRPGAPPMPRNFLVMSGRPVQTNDLGEFRLFGLAPGDYYVQAMPNPAHGGWSATGETTMLATYFPATEDASAAQTITLGGGQTAGDIVIRMISVPAFRVSGVVLDESRRPVVNAMVNLVRESTGPPVGIMRGWVMNAHTDEGGRFTIAKVTSGGYTLVAVAPEVISGPADASRGGGVAAGGYSSWVGMSAGGANGTAGGGVTTHTSNGVAVQYRDDAATRVPITVDQANVSGVEVVVRTPARR